MCHWHQLQNADKRPHCGQLNTDQTGYIFQFSKRACDCSFHIASPNWNPRELWNKKRLKKKKKKKSWLPKQLSPSNAWARQCSSSVIKVVNMLLIMSMCISGRLPLKTYCDKDTWVTWVSYVKACRCFTNTCRRIVPDGTKTKTILAQLSLWIMTGHLDWMFQQPSFNFSVFVGIMQ